MEPLEPAVVARILDELSDGRSLRSVCKGGGMPSVWAFLRRVGEDATLAQQYARAKEAGIEAMAEDILAISDDAERDWEPIKGQDGETVGIKVDGEHVQRAKLMVDSRKWLLSKLAPKKYGDKVAHTGPNGDDPIQHAVRVTFG